MNEKIADPSLCHIYHILAGSNIEPEKNIPLAVDLLSTKVDVCAVSSVWETKAVGSPNSPNFLNLAAHIRSPLPPHELRRSVLYAIEDQLGRVRTQDKNAPRTIDLDIILMDGKVVDPNLWTQAFIAIPISELQPSLVDQSNESLLNIIDRLHFHDQAVFRQDVLINFS